jgi:putative tricarboxylic transport membrane protein
MILGAVMILIAAIYLILIFRIQRRDVIDATFIPFILSGALFLLGAVQISGTLFGKKKIATEAERKSASEKADDACEDKTAKIDTPTVIKTIALIVAYVAFLDLVGFMIMSIIYLFAQFIVLTPLNRKKNYLAYGIIAVVASVGIYLIFRYVFSMMLPEGLLK